ncbi:hypothetical protein Tco_0899026 [Tanacetum coccineum]
MTRSTCRTLRSVWQIQHCKCLWMRFELNFVEEPVEILEREFKKLKHSRIAIVNIQWNSKRGPEFTLFHAMEEVGSELGSELTFLAGSELRTSELDTSELKTSELQGRQNRGHGNNARGAGAAGYRGAQNRVGNANPGQARQLYRMTLDEEQLLFIAGGQDNIIDKDVDEQPVQDLALNVDNVFQADDCDAFDSDVDEAPTTQTMFMANLSSADPVYDEACSVL